MRHLYQQSQAAIPELPSFEDFRAQGMFKKRDPAGHHVAYHDFRTDPVANPLSTPSGKIEIYSAALAEIAATWELQKMMLSIRCPCMPPVLKAMLIH